MKQEKGYNIPFDKVDLTFTKDHGVFKSGDKTSVSLPIAIKWINKGVANMTADITRLLTKHEMSDLINITKPEKASKKADETV